MRQVPRARVPGCVGASRFNNQVIAALDLEWQGTYLGWLGVAQNATLVACECTKVAG